MLTRFTILVIVAESARRFNEMPDEYFCYILFVALVVGVLDVIMEAVFKK